MDGLVPGNYAGLSNAIGSVRTVNITVEAKINGAFGKIRTLDDPGWKPGALSTELQRQHLSTHHSMI